MLILAIPSFTFYCEMVIFIPLADFNMNHPIKNSINQSVNLQIFVSRMEDDWVFQGGGGCHMYPEFWEELVEALPVVNIYVFDLAK